MTTAAVSFRATSFHAAPDRSRLARSIGLAQLALWPARFKGGDLNVTPGAAARALRRRVIGTGVLCLAMPRRGWKAVGWEAVDVGGDHDALLATVRHIATGTVLTVLVINCMSVSTGQLHAKSIMRAGLALDPDLIIASECRDFTGATLWGADGYAWHQPGTLDSPESGSLVACRNDTLKMTERRLKLGSAATPVGKIGARSMVRARFTTRTAA